MQSSYRIEEPQLQWKNDTMRHLNVPIILFHVLESLQMQSEYHRQLFDAHSLLSLLIGAAIITFKLIITTQRFGVAEAFQAMRYRCVLINVHLQIEKVLVFAADSLAVETTRLAGEHALEDFVHPCWLVGRRWGRRGAVGGRWGLNGHAIAIQRRLWLAALISLGENDLVDVINEKVEEFVGVLLHIIVEFFLLFSQTCDELLWRYRADFLLLGGDGVESTRNRWYRNVLVENCRWRKNS